MPCHEWHNCNHNQVSLSMLVNCVQTSESSSDTHLYLALTKNMLMNKCILISLYINEHIVSLLRTSVFTGHLQSLKVITQILHSIKDTFILRQQISSYFVSIRRRSQQLQNDTIWILTSSTRWMNGNTMRKKKFITNIIIVLSS